MLLRQLVLLTILVHAGHAALAQCGHCKPENCGDARTDCCQPTCLICQAHVTTEKITRQCFETDCKYVCVPPVKLPFGNGCLPRLCSGIHGDDCGPACGGCGGQGCAECSGVCTSDGCNSDGLLTRLCSRFAEGRIRAVRSYTKKEYDCGEKCVVTWKVVCAPINSCGDYAKSCGEACRAPSSCCAPCSR